MTKHPQQLFFKVAAQIMRFSFVIIFAVAGARAAMVGIGAFADDLALTGSLAAMPYRDVVGHCYTAMTALVFTLASIILLMNRHILAVYAVVAGLYVTFTIWQVAAAPDLRTNVAQYVPTLFALLFASVFEHLSLPLVQKEKRDIQHVDF